jgi:predicted dinucleotide-binding enzyme
MVLDCTRTDDELEENRRPNGADRIAIGAAGDDELAVRKVMRLLDRLGFDPVDAGPLQNSLALEPDGSPIATTYSADQLTKLVSRYPEHSEADRDCL